MTGAQRLMELGSKPKSQGSPRKPYGQGTSAPSNQKIKMGETEIQALSALSRRKQGFESPREDAAAKMATPTYETREKQSVFVKTLAAIRNIIGDREEITSRVIVDELARIEGGPWAEWGKGRKPITRTRSHGCSNRTMSLRPTSAPSTRGAKATGVRSSSARKA